jgi:hypothetical protein
MLLTPTDPFRRVDMTALRQAMRQGGLIGDDLPGVEGGFLVGERFLELITFAGCSVRLELAPPDAGSGPFCHVRFLGPFDPPVLMQGRNTRPPRCPACRAPARDWHEVLVESPKRAAPLLHCPACGARQPPWLWDWKGTAGYGSCFVAIEEVFPGEATPTPGLYATLKGVTASPWRHFCVQD